MSLVALVAKRIRGNPRTRRWIIGAVVLALATGLLALPVAAAGQAPETPHPEAGYEDCAQCHGPSGIAPAPASHASYGQVPCLGCHPRNPDATAANDCLICHAITDAVLKLDSGESIPVRIDPESQHGTAHAGALECADCHPDHNTYPHAAVTAPGWRSYTRQNNQACQTCHPDEFATGQDGIHAQKLASGDIKAPACSDCHGVHPVMALADSKVAAAASCARCHQQTYRTYRDSVHGAALAASGNSDVPACSDCHQAHQVPDPETAAFRLGSVELCANCHGDAALMAKYGLSTNVVTSYLQDFHGATVALVEKEDRDVWVEEAVCTDCHGIHDIQAVDDPDSRVVKANLVATCEECHPGATENFPSAWLSHYEPTAKKAPLVFLVKLFYWIMIPFVLVGLSIHIGLDLWRARKHRKSTKTG